MVGRCPVLQHSFPKAGWLLGPTSFWRAACHSSPALSSLQSDSSYDFLSAEEKECLLFLEETIGSLDTEADSGLSTEKSEQATTPRGPRALPTTQPAPQGKTDCLKKNKKRLHPPGHFPSCLPFALRVMGRRRNKHSPLYLWLE